MKQPHPLANRRIMGDGRTQIGWITKAAFEAGEFTYVWTLDYPVALDNPELFFPVWVQP